MGNPDLIGYIKKEQEKGISKGRIIETLVEKGWDPIKVEEAFNSPSKKKKYIIPTKLLIILAVALSALIVSLLVYAFAV